MQARISKSCEYQYFRFCDDRKIFKSQLYISVLSLVPVLRNVIPVTFILVYAAKQMLCLIFFIHTANPTLVQMWLILPLLVIISTQCLSSRYAISYCTLKILLYLSSPPFKSVVEMGKVSEESGYVST